MSTDYQERWLRDTRVELLLKRVDNSRLPALGAVAVLSVLFLPSVGLYGTLTWSVSVIFVYGLRDLLVWFRVRRPKRQNDEYPKGSDDVICWSSAALTFVINFPAVVFLPVMPTEIGSLYVVIMVGWLLIAVHIIGIHTRSYAMYVGVAFVYLAVGWWQIYEPAVAVLASLTLVGGGWVLITYSRNTAEVFENSVKIAHAERATKEALRGAFTKALQAQQERSQSLADAAHDILQPAYALPLFPIPSTRSSQPPAMR